MKKELTIAAKFDTSDFDKTVESMQKKLKDIYAPADNIRAQQQTSQRMQQVGMQSPVGAVTQDQMAKATQQKVRDTENLIKSEAQGQEKVGKLLAQRVEKMKELQKLQSEMIRGSEEEVKIREKMSRIEENNRRLNEVYQGKAANVSALIQERERITNMGQTHSDYGQMPKDFAGAMDDFGGGPKPPRGGNVLGLMSGAAGVIGTVGGAIGATGAIAERFTGYGQRLESAKGSAVAGTTGKDLQDVYAGRSPFESAFTKEREASAGLSKQKEDRNRVTDRMKGIGSVLGIGAGVLGIGAGLAGGAASIAAAPFTAGASLAGLPAAGAMLAGGTAAFGAGVSGLSNDRNRKGIFGGQEYEQLLASQRAQDFRSSYEDLKNQDPEKRLTIDKFEQDREANVRSQRQLGLSNKQFYGEGGFLESNKNQGFGREQAMQMASSIIAAGGSARTERKEIEVPVEKQQFQQALTKEENKIFAPQESTQDKAAKNPNIGMDFTGVDTTTGLSTKTKVERPVEIKEPEEIPGIPTAKSKKIDWSDTSTYPGNKDVQEPLKPEDFVRKTVNPVEELSSKKDPADIAQLGKDIGIDLQSANSTSKEEERPTTTKQEVGAGTVGLGNQLERAGLNGAQMVGSLSASIQSPEANRRATISIMSEAFKIGLDNTEFAEENRKFTTAAAGIIGRTGVTEKSDQDRISETLAQFLGSRTNAGVQNAQGDYEKFQERSSQMTGRRGALRFSSAMQDKDVSKLSASDQTELLSMRDEDLNEKNPALHTLAKDAGISVEELISKRKDIDKKGRFVGPGQKERIAGAKKTVDEYMEKSNKSLAEIGDDINSGKAPKEVTEAIGRMQLELSKTDNEKGITSGEGIGKVGELLKTVGKGRTEDTKTKAEKLLEQGEGRIEDSFTKKSAEGADEARKAFTGLNEELWKVVKNVDTFKEAVVQSGSALKEAAEVNKAGLPQSSGTNEDIAKAIAGGNAKTQQQGAKPKGR